MKRIVGHTVGHFLKTSGFLAILVSLVWGILNLADAGLGVSVGLLGAILGLLTYGMGELINIAFDIHQMMRGRRPMYEGSGEPEEQKVSEGA